MSNNVLPLSAVSEIEAWRSSGKKIVLVSGVFDLLHKEHRNFLHKAKALGDVLIVTIESDVRVRQLKGEGRPVNPQDIRKAELEALGIVDQVYILPEEFSRPEHHRQLIAEVRPDIFAVSSHTSHLEKKRVIIEEFGGRLVIAHEHNPDISTTQLLARSLEK